MNNIEALLMTITLRYPPDALGVLLTAAALSFLARYRAQRLYGRIREYREAPLSMAAATGALAILYLTMGHTDTELDVIRGMVRLLLSLLAVATVLFNWGGVRATWHDLCNGKKGRV